MLITMMMFDGRQRQNEPHGDSNNNYNHRTNQRKKMELPTMCIKNENSELKNLK